MKFPLLQNSAGFSFVIEMELCEYDLYDIVLNTWKLVGIRINKTVKS